MLDGKHVMKTMAFSGYGGSEKLGLREMPLPTADSGQIRVRVGATSINPIDWKLHSGSLRWVKPIRFPSIPCFDFAGTVETTGPDAATWVVGDRVYGMLPINRLGAAAEFLVVDGPQACPIPPGLDLNSMAGLPLAGMTALQGLRDQGRLQSGQRLLVIGAAGGVGHYAVQIARLLGAEVSAICGSRNIGFCEALGANTVLDYSADRLELPFSKFDLILDCAGYEPFRKWHACLKPQGRFVALLPSMSLGLNALKVWAFGQQRITLTVVKSRREDLVWLADQMLAGGLKTTIDQVFHLEDLPDAFEKSREGHARGKIIVSLTA